MSDAIAASEQQGLRIGELAARVGTTTDTIRYYEKDGWLPRPPRAGNTYRTYAPEDVEHIRLLLELRRLDVPLPDASKLASWCHSGHCADTTAVLPELIAGQRRSIAERMGQLQSLDARLASLERHLRQTVRSALPVMDTSSAPCCESAAAVTSPEGTCRCCIPA